MSPDDTMDLPAGACGEAEIIANAEHFDRVVRDGICTAKVSLDIATADFKAMLVPDGMTRAAPSIVDVLGRLARRGVEIRLLHAGVPSAAALRALGRGVPRGLTIRRCPRVHAKCVIVDCATMYLGSANLTGAGLGAKADNRRNFEMGVWTRSSAMIDRALDVFNAVWEAQHCRTCGRRDVCPVPLEEPEL
jgi:phosphatidylserine/phosphatidylglycerophosphate/cardiolipin synthase-like enzyme